MRLTVVGSSSAGNAYILESSQGEALLVECGVRFNKIQQALGFNLKKVVGCIITHEHQDHCAAAQDLAARGINIYASAGTFGAMKAIHDRQKKIVPHQTVVPIGSFRIMSFDVRHDAAEPVGYIIHHEECGYVLFLTDTYYAPYVFPGLHNIIVEANYSQEIIDERVSSGVNPKFLRDRVLQSHMSLATCAGLLEANDLSTVNNIVLIHLSDSNSNSRQFREHVAGITGKTVWVAEPGMIIEDFNISPF